MQESLNTTSGITITVTNMTREPYRKWDYLVDKWQRMAWGSQDGSVKRMGDELIKEAEYLFDRPEED